MMVVKCDVTVFMLKEGIGLSKQVEVPVVQCCMLWWHSSSGLGIEVGGLEQIFSDHKKSHLVFRHVR
jgi:hypothetical protein